jgi:hypothetical protein
MTAFSSILGFLPLVIASGAGAASRRAVGNAIVGGMIAATLFSLLLVPVFFLIFQWLGERVSKPRVEIPRLEPPPPDNPVQQLQLAAPATELPSPV